MTMKEALSRINHHLVKANRLPIDINVRPSSSGPGNTIEVLNDQEVLFKSINGGAVTTFLKGMFTALQGAPAPTIGKMTQDELFSFKRRVDLS